MTLGVVLGWALCGLIVGLLVPGRNPLRILRTILLAVVGAFVGGGLYWAIYRGPGDPLSLSANAWHGLIFSTIGAVIVLVLYGWSRRSRTSW